MDTHANEREALRTIQAIFENAVKNNTIDDLRPYIAPDFSFVSFTDRAFSDFDSFCKQWKITREEMVGNGSFSTALNPNTTLFVDDIAIASGNSENAMVDKTGALFNFESNWTVVFKRIDNQWKVLRAHNSLDPFTNPILKHGVKKILTKYCLLGFLLGASLCALVLFLT